MPIIYYIKSKFESTTASSYSVGYMEKENGEFTELYNFTSHGDALEKCKELNGVKNKEDEEDEKISLRDYFAGKALGNMAIFPINSLDDIDVISIRAYQYADAMLKERSRVK